MKEIQVNTSFGTGIDNYCMMNVVARDLETYYLKFSFIKMKY